MALSPATPKIATDNQTQRAVRDAIREYYRMREQGVSTEDACKGLTMVFRDAFERFRPPDDDPIWFQHAKRCLTCGDSGFEAFERFERVYQAKVTWMRYCHCTLGQRMQGNAQEAATSGKRRRRSDGPDIGDAMSAREAR
jgi:hypothetical protein